jgi:hypothetical protein
MQTFINRRKQKIYDSIAEDCMYESIILTASRSLVTGLYLD